MANLAKIALDQVCFLYLTLQSVPKIFVVKFESCPKSSRIFDFLALPNFRSAAPPKFVHKWSCPL